MTIQRKYDPIHKLYKRKQWKRVSQMVIEREHGVCQHCHRPIQESYNIHHIELASPSNFYDLDNLTLLHIECHQLITNHEGVKRQECDLYEVSLTTRTNLLNFRD